MKVGLLDTNIFRDRGWGKVSGALLGKWLHNSAVKWLIQLRTYSTYLPYNTGILITNLLYMSSVQITPGTGFM